MIWLWLALGCPGKVGPAPVVVGEAAPGAGSAGEVTPERAAPIGPAVGPGTWEDEEAGLILQVPQGWSGVAASPGAAVRLELTHAVSHARFRVVVSNDPALPEYATCSWRFHDGGGHRSAPGLGVAATSSCIPTDPGGETVWAWTSEGPSQVVRLELWSAPDHVVASRVAAEPLIGSVLRR